MTAVDHPLRLAVGSHSAGSGKGCAMNVISWESGDTTITDFPACADRMLAKIVQRVNDTICTHRDGDLLCPTCSVEVLALGHRIVGTGTHPLTDAERRQVWVRVAADQARQVLHLAEDQAVALRAIEAAEGWCEGTVTAEECHADAAADAADAADAAAYYAAAADAAANAYAADAAAYAAAAAYDANAADARLRMAHRAIDVWCERAGFTPQPTSTEVTAAAIAQMMEVAK